jgi:hypothetical protein
MATNKTPGGAKAEGLEASNRNLMKALAGRSDPFTSGRFRKGKGTGGIKLTPADEGRPGMLQPTLEVDPHYHLTKKVVTPYMAEKAKDARRQRKSAEQLQEEVELAKRFYYRAVSAYTEDNDRAGARALFDRAQALLEKAASSDQSDAVPGIKEKVRRHAAMISSLYGDTPNGDNEKKTGKTGAKDEGLLQRPQQQEPAKSAERLPTVRARAETTRRLTKALRPHELSEFLAHAAAHPWDSNGSVRPSDHIKTQFAKWLKLGLSRSDLVTAQPNLAQAYATETSRNPARRIKGLVVRPHKLPPGAKPAISMRPVWQLTKKELEAKRTLEREKKQRQRHRQKNATFTPS